MDLFFNGQVGFPPPPDTLEFAILAACAAESRARWKALCNHSLDEIEDAIDNLRQNGWGFEWTTFQ